MMDAREPRKRIAIIKDLKRYLELKINEHLFRIDATGSEFFLCSSYIASVVSEFAKHFPTMWRAAEELWMSRKKEGYNPYELESGGKKCFIICVFFPELRKRRNVEEGYYLKLGASLFFDHYLITCRETSYYMSGLFNDLVNITDRVIRASV